MHWNKKGLIIEPRKNLSWFISHAMLPLADRIGMDRFRIYFSGRNKQNMSQIGYVEIDLNKPQNILYITESPILQLGPLGSFDDSGVFPSWIAEQSGKKYMYYIGWTQGKRIPFFGFLGLAISTDGGKTFQKYSKSPILERNDTDAYSTLSACVRIENGLWRMWYVSTTRWEMVNGNPTPYYHIKYAESNDGINWNRIGHVSIDFKYEGENAIARPCVIKENDSYKMWYCYSGYKGMHYRIGYAESNDGKNWERKDNEAGIDISKTGWDSEMVAYPFVFKHKGKKYMLYNGNKFGKDGVGLAVLNKN